MEYALVTGGTSGIGLAIVNALLDDGYFVYINYSNNEERAEQVRIQLSKYDGFYSFIRADLSEYSSINLIVSKLNNVETKLSALVLNFGMTDRSDFGSITVEGWEKVLRANVSVPFFIIQSLYEEDLFLKGASIICIGSLMASMPHSVSVSYGVSKSAMSAMCQNLVKMLSPKEIRINTIEPGFIDTPWQKEKAEEQRKRIIDKTALNRFGEPEEVASACVAIIKNTFINGSILHVSGGYGLI